MLEDGFQVIQQIILLDRLAQPSLLLSLNIQDKRRLGGEQHNPSCGRHSGDLSSQCNGLKENLHRASGLVTCIISFSSKVSVKDLQILEPIEFVSICVQNPQSF